MVFFFGVFLMVLNFAFFLKRDKQRFLVKDNQTNAEEAAAARAVVANRSFFSSNANHDDGVDDFQREFSCHVHTRQSKA